MTSFRTASRFAISLILVAITVAVSAQPCLAGSPQLNPKEQGTPTGHIVGDTIARGIEFVLKPLHVGLSNAYFRVSKPPKLRHVTAIKMEDSQSRQHNM